MHEEIEPNPRCDDGFRTPDDGEADYVTWDVEKTDKQNIHYLHGALHIFDAGSEIQKFTWINTGFRLLQQIQAALAVNKFPLIVAEGRSEQKMEKIIHSNYLSRSYRSFAKIGGTLFVYGISMSETDEHIIRLIEKSKLSSAVVGLYGDVESLANQKIRERMDRAQEQRPANRPLRISFFDAASASVWG